MTGSATRSSRRGTGGGAGERSTDLRLATLHLRTGMLTLARAELESMAGEGTLDDDALLDLGEVRWRTGDLAGAGDAATAYLDAGQISTLAFVIAAEAQAALGRPAEARRLANLALAGASGSLDAIFAGMPRATLWPADGDDAAPPNMIAEPAGATDDAAAGAARSSEVATSVGPMSASTAALNAVTHQPVALPDGQTQLEAAQAALDVGDIETAAVRLGLVLRVAPVLAPAVLEAAASAPSPLLDLVRGDAFRLLGREIAARRLFLGAIDALDAAADAAGAETGPTGSATTAENAPTQSETRVDPPADGQVPLPFALPSDGSDPSADTEPEAS